MKINGPGPFHAAEAARVRRKESKNTSFAKELEDSAPEFTARLGANAGVAAMDALLALQEVPDATARRSAGVKRGFDLLDRLDEIRMGLLLGQFRRKGWANWCELSAANGKA